MIKKLLLMGVFITTFLNVFTQNIITWEVLKNVEFDEINLSMNFSETFFSRKNVENYEKLRTFEN